MENQQDVRGKLKLQMQRRVKKLMRLRWRMRLWGAAGVLCAIAACTPPLLYLLTGMRPVVADSATLFVFAPGWRPVLVIVGVGLFGTLLFYRQFRKDKDKYTRIRAGAVEQIQAGDPICECRWIPCNCKDDLVKQMKEQHDINLSY